MLLSALLLWAAATPPDTGPTRHAVLLMGSPRGTQTTTVSADGERRIAFEYADRGRGPKLETRVRLAPDGTPVLLETNGHDYLNQPVQERFALEEGRARWRNKGEAGERRLQTRAFYASFDGVPDELGLLARALLQAPGGRLPLLPEGEASIERVGGRTIRSALSERRVVHYALSGLDFGPTPVWLEEDGGFFASVSSWLTVVREGWEGCVEELLATQTEAASERAAALARRASRRPGRPLAIRHVRLFDAETATTRDGMTVVVVGDRIAAVGADGTVDVREGAEVVDASGATLLPGLWDMHAHVSENDGPLNVAAGITSVRDLANDPETLARLRTRWEAGAAVGPRVVAAGFIDGPGPYAGPTTALAASAEEGRALVASYAEKGYTQIKLYSSLRPELVAPLAAEAHRRGLRVSGHVPAFMSAEAAVRAGYDEIQHVNMIFLNFWADTVQDTRTPLRFTAVAEKAAELDFASPRTAAFLDFLRDRRVVVDPTVSVFETMFTARPGSLAPGWQSVAERLPSQIRRSLLAGGLPVPEGMDGRYRDSFRALLQMVRALHESGVPIVAGTDALAGFALHRELELYVDAGLPAPEVLRIATWGAARVAGRDKDLGSVAAGKKADLLLVDGDPTRRISDVRRARTVVKDGIVYDPAVIHDALGIRPPAPAPTTGP